MQCAARNAAKKYPNFDILIPQPNFKYPNCVFSQTIKSGPKFRQHMFPRLRSTRPRQSMAVSSDDEQVMDDGIYRDASPVQDDEDGDGGNYQGAGHQCPVCFKVFVSSKGLVQHSIVHTDRKPFQCEICQKAFRFKSNLFEHRSIHSGEQPFVCPYCGKACRLKGNLKKHLKTHVRDPGEIEQAYEAVTSAHASANSSMASRDVAGNVEYIDESYEDYQNTQMNRSTPRVKRRLVAPATPGRRPQTKKEDMSSAAAVLIRVLQDENNELLAEGTAAYPPLSDMFGPRFSMDDFVRAAKAMPFEKYHCRSCQLTFNCRFDMEEHCEHVHDISRRLSKKEKRDALLWCDTCLRDFEDQKSYDQHLFFHRRIRALINKCEIHVSEPIIRTFP